MSKRALPAFRVGQQLVVVQRVSPFLHGQIVTVQLTARPGDTYRYYCTANKAIGGWLDEDRLAPAPPAAPPAVQLPLFVEAES